jgi:hypothetical protein
VEGNAAGFGRLRFFCYKRQLASVGDALLEIKAQPAEIAPVESKGTGKL